MTKFFCDRCKKELHGHFSVLSLGDDTLDLCDDCYAAVVAFATGLPEPQSIEVAIPGRPDTTTQLAAICENCGHCCYSDAVGRFVCLTALCDCPESGTSCMWAACGR